METFSYLTFGAICLIIVGFVALFYFLIDWRSESRRNFTRFIDAIDRNEKLAVSLANQQKDTASPKVHKRIKKNKVVRITESQRALQELEELRNK
jgi:hypothetical protein